MTYHKSSQISVATPPDIGLGYWKIPNDRVAQLTVDAIKSGYRHLDCACDYGNEAEVGQGISQAVQNGLCTREDLWVTSKLWNTFHRPEHVRLAAEKSLSDLRLDYLDLYLVHFPIALEYVPVEKRYPPGWFFDPEAENPVMKSARVPLAETWGAMEELVKAGLVKQIGVANFGVSLLRDLQNSATIAPSVLQVELHPYLTQEKLLRYCRESGVHVTAFSPFGAISYVPLGMAGEEESVMNEPAIQQIATKHNRTVAQVLLRWAVQRGTSVIPKTSRPERLAENLAAGGFELSEPEMDAISALNRNRRFNDPGDFCESAFHTFFPIYE
jgi:D-xylose reductase